MEIYCCRCNRERRVENSKLFTKTGFSTIKCGNSKCGKTAGSDRWNCRCTIQWIKCPRHIHIASMPKKRQSKEADDKKKRLAIYGTTKPKPILKPRVMAKHKKTRDLQTPGKRSRSLSRYAYSEHAVGKDPKCSVGEELRRCPDQQKMSGKVKRAKYYYGEPFHRIRQRLNE